MIASVRHLVFLFAMLVLVGIVHLSSIMLMPQIAPTDAWTRLGRFETGPGEQMQVDWATMRRGADRLSVFVATLGWSRAAYVEFVIDERLETLIAAHENPFLAFGGLPREALFDTSARSWAA